MRATCFVALAVRESIGERAPHDKFQRSMVRTLAGLAAGDFTVDIDGRLFADGEAVVVCEGSVAVRFFISRGRRAGRRTGRLAAAALARTEAGVS